MERWQRIETLFQGALEQPSSEREAWLQRACGSDPDLLGEVGSLVAHHRKEDSGVWGAAAAAQLIGTRLGVYEIRSQIGEGGMGAVFRAWDARLCRDVAIKVLPSAFASDPDRLARFTREAQVLASLNHPNITSVFGVEDGALVMELVEGPTLAERLERGAMPWAEALPIARQIADALEYAHEKGVVHRDLKPANIKVTPEGRVKVLDFGLAKAFSRTAGDATLTKGLTNAGAILGTAGYMAPEQARGETVDKRADIWAFGVVLYEMLSGRRAFAEETVPETLAAVLKKDVDWTALPPQMPAGVQRLLRLCLDRDPARRLRHAAVAMIKIDEALAAPGEAIPALPSTLRWLWIAAGTLIVGLLTGWAFARLGTKSELGPTYVEIEPPNGGQFEEDSISISPDGRTLAFVARVKEQRMLWVRSLNVPAARAIPGTDNARYPFWSPDGRSLGYFAGTKLWRVDLIGGTPQAISNAPMARGGTWSEDGTIIFGTFQGPLQRVPASGGSPAVMTRMDERRGDFNQYWPQVLPNGKFLFWDRSSGDTNSGVYASAVDHAQKSELILNTSANGIYAGGYLFWQRENSLVAKQFDLERLKVTGPQRTVVDSLGAIPGGGRLIAAVSGRGTLVYGSMQSAGLLRWVDRSGKALPSPAERVADRGSLRLSPDGRLALVSRVSSDGMDLWMLEADREIWNRFTFLPGVSVFPVWSPDGRAVIFRAGRPRNLYRKDSSGAGTEQRITESGGAQFATDWSRDGKFVLLHQTGPDTQSDLWVLPVNSNGSPAGQARAYLQTRANEWYGRFAPEPNPRWLAYVSDESGRDEVYIQAFPEPRAKLQISSGGGQYPVWNPNGRELFFLDFNNKLMSVPLKLGPDSVDKEVPRELFSVPQNAFGIEAQFDVAPDGNRFLVRSTVGSGAALHVILNWHSLLR